MGRFADKFDIAHGPRPVQPEVCTSSGELLGRSLVAQLYRRRIARSELIRYEDDEGDEEQAQNAKKQPDKDGFREPHRATILPLATHDGGAGDSITKLDAIHDRHPEHHLTEHGVVPVQERMVVEQDEEL